MPKEDQEKARQDKPDRAEEERKIFISHRHEDRRIADALRKQIKSWGIRSSCIFQSSDHKHGAGVGKPIKDELRAFLYQARMVILIYTFSEHNWEFCMWECGLATDARTQATKIVVIQCTEDIPRVYQDEFLVAIELTRIAQFTLQFHKEPDFFPGLPAFDPEIGGEALDTRSEALYEALEPLVPKRKLRREIRWGYFTVNIPAAIADQIKESETAQEGESLCSELQDDMGLKRARGWGVRHFGFHQYDEDLTLGRLLKRWEEEAVAQNEGKRLKQGETQWMPHLRSEISRTIRKENPRLTWEPFRSVYPEIDWWVYPVINEARYLPDGGMDLDVYVYRVPPPSKEVKSQRKG